MTTILANVAICSKQFERSTDASETEPKSLQYFASNAFEDGMRWCSVLKLLATVVLASFRVRARSLAFVLRASEVWSDSTRSISEIFPPSQRWSAMTTPISPFIATVRAD
eukprot:3529067-Amphidinium_carterae.1